MYYLIGKLDNGVFYSIVIGKPAYFLLPYSRDI